MKKVISIVLALLMMLPIAAMLVPTASAVVPAVQPDFGATGQTYVDLDFDDPALADLVDKDLTAALGWKSPNQYVTMLIEEGENGDNQMRIVTQYTSSGTYPADPTKTTSGDKWAGNYNTNLVVDDDVLLNTIYVEYKFTYQRRPAGSEDVVTTTKDGKTKTIKADGQGSYQFAGVHFAPSAGGGKDNILGRINHAGDGYNNTWRWGNGKWNGAEWSSFFTQNYAAIKTNPDQPKTSFEIVDNPLDGWKNVGTAEQYFDDTPRAKDVRNIMDIEHTFKAIFDPLLGVFRVYVDDALVLSTTYSWTDDWGAKANNCRALLTNAIGLWVKPGFDFLIDDLKIAQYTPALEITEAMINGGYVSGKGNYQYIELTNSSDEVVNVYDHALHIYNMCTETSATKATIGGELHGTRADYLANKPTEASLKSYYNEASGSYLAYFTPGAKTLANGDVFDSPAYEDGTLQPGESAVVLIPDLAMLGTSNKVTDEAFLTYLKTLNADFDGKIFVADNTSDNPCVMAHYTNETFCVGVMQATNTATDGSYAPVAVGAGENVQQMFNYHESMALFSDKTGGGSALFGGSNWTPASGNWPAGALVGVGSATTGNKSAEVEYYGMLKTGAYNIMGFGRKATAARSALDGTQVYATPGYVPVEYRADIDLDFTAADGKTSKIYATRMSNEITVPVTKKTGYMTQVWVDGVLVVEDAKGTEVTVPTAQAITGTYTPNVEVKYYREGSMFIGFQKSEVAEDGTYTLRLLAAINDPDAYDAFGFNILMEWDGGWESKEISYDVGYVYEAVTAYDNGDATLVTAADYGFDYLYAVHIKNVPSDIEDLTITASATYTMAGETKEAVEGVQILELNVAE